MADPDFAVFSAHWAFWGAFGVTRVVLRIRDRRERGQTAAVPTAGQEITARFSRALLAFHALAFAVVYFGMGRAVIRGRVPVWFSGQRIAGALVIATGAALVVSALV